MPIYIKVNVRPDSKKESIRKQANGRLIINVKEPAEDNRANDRILEIVRKLYPNQPLKIISGHHAPNKTILVGRE